MGFYFDKFEDVKPYTPIPYSAKRELLYQFFAVFSLVLGAWYIHWRWTSSLNYDALWFAIPLVIAETFGYIGLIIFTINIWKVQDTEQLPPPRTIAECIRNADAEHQRPVSVDFFIATYNEDPELVRLSIQDAKRIRYPHEIDLKIHVLDDGKRPNMERVSREEGVNYITRETNIGFKAGNLRNAMEQTYGDFIVICDADTRYFPTALEHMLGYFRDPDVAWVQSPHWFYDLTEGKPLPVAMQKYLGVAGKWIGTAIEKVTGPIQVGRDRFVNDTQMFFDVIQRRRNWANASFCCGAGSIHRREAIMEVAMKTFADSIDGEVRRLTSEVRDKDIKASLADAMKRELVLETEVTPYKFHVSEDIYTSIVLHSDPTRNWKSVYHPPPEAKMLSPQDLLSWTIQRFKYAGGSLDIAVNDNPVFKKGMSLPQKFMYGATFWSYFSALWNIVFLLAPVIYLFTDIAPVSAYSFDFYKHVIPFLLINEIAGMIGTWGISSWAGSATYLSFFPVSLRALWTVFKGEKISFPTTPKDRQEGNFLHLVWPQLTIIILTVVGMVWGAIKIAMGWSPHVTGFITNSFWCINNIWALSGMVLAAVWKPEEE